MTDPGLERVLRQALHTQLTLRLRQAFLHGLKSPAQTILSALLLLQKKAAAGEISELAKYAEWATNAAHEITGRAESILPAQAAAETGTSPCDLSALIEETLRLLRDEAAMKGVFLEYEASAGEVPLACRRSEMQLVLRAVFLGALDSASEGAALPISLGVESEHLRLTIDLPAGQPPKEAFELLYEVPPPRSGIAWHVARGIVEKHGGQLLIDSKTGDGWRVTMRLPRLALPS